MHEVMTEEAAVLLPKPPSCTLTAAGKSRGLGAPCSWPDVGPVQRGVQQGVHHHQPWEEPAMQAPGGEQQAIGGFSCSHQGFAGKDGWLGVAGISFQMYKIVLATQLPFI